MAGRLELRTRGPTAVAVEAGRTRPARPVSGVLALAVRPVKSASARPSPASSLCYVLTVALDEREEARRRRQRGTPAERRSGSQPRDGALRPTGATTKTSTPLRGSAPQLRPTATSCTAGHAVCPGNCVSTAPAAPSCAAGENVERTGLAGGDGDVAAHPGVAVEVGVGRDRARDRGAHVEREAEPVG